MGDALNGRFMKTTLSDDIYGTEYAAILKNVVAMAAGISVGLRYGDNFRAVLVSRAIQEIERFVDAVHPIQRDINEPAYLGDLLVTAWHLPAAIASSAPWWQRLQRAGRAAGDEHGGRRLLRREVRARSTSACRWTCPSPRPPTASSTAHRPW